MNSRAISPWFLGLSLLAAIPVLYPSYPPMLDLPQHVASIMVLDEVHFGDYRYAELFDFNWFRPYWLGYSLIWVFSYAVGLVWAAKIVVAAAIVAFIWSLAYLRRELNAPSLVDWLFLAVPFGFAYEWGFLNFMVSAPLGPLFLVSYHRFLKGEASRWLIVGWMFVLFFGHLLILAFFCLVASMMALRDLPSLKLLVRRVAPLLISIPIGIFWLSINVEPRNFEMPTVWGDAYFRVVSFLPNIFSLGYNWSDIALATFLLALPFLLGVRPRKRLGSVLPPVFYLLFMMLVPSQFYNNLGTYERFQMFGVMFLVLMLEDAEVVPLAWMENARSMLMVLPAVVGLGLLVQVGIRAHGYDQESREFREMLGHTQPERRALSMVHEKFSEFYIPPVFIHFPLWYQVEQRGLVDFNFAEWPSLNSYYKPEHRTGLIGRFAWHPEEFDWETHHGDRYDYFMVRGSREFAAWLFRNDGHRIRVLYAGEKWFLFERIQ